MLNVSKTFLFSSALSFISFTTHAKIYSDQIVLDNLGEDVCRSDYRPLNHTEAQQHKTALLSRMNVWDIAGLKNDWVIMGSGYHGLIKQGQSSDNTWCYPNTPDAGLPYYEEQVIAANNNHNIQRALVSNNIRFIRPLSYLGHNLGYAWVGGDNARYVGQDMTIKPLNNGWEIKGTSNGSCAGDRCNEKTTITVDNFAYTLDNSSFLHGSVTETDQELIKNVSAYAINDSEQPKQIVVDLHFEQSTQWSKTQRFDLADSVAIEETFHWPQVGKTEVSVALVEGQRFSDINSGARFEPTELQAIITVPAHSVLPFQVEFLRSTISYPYRIKTNMSYDVNFTGFLRHSGNALSSHPTNRPTVSHTFTMGTTSEDGANIRYQWDHRYIPGEMKWWDWSWAINTHGLSSMQYAAGASVRPFYTYVAGQFSAESQYSGMIDIGTEHSVDSFNAMTPSGSYKTYYAGDIKVMTDFDPAALAQLGYDNAQLTLTPTQ
ncbi:aerolysin family beta-barrel pore-forming toxin [Vibrio sp. 10N.261.46.E12]|uniref:aerolysin family beta-barrel pore-forming toxin n=1 Tax=unclassified Vibrio TaxID=2614977 RepID=UPI0009764DB1|nr:MULTISPECIES: aerolysin family beta-barrel pore-forming toxin [unclassified Vibrio]OMO35229.1 aerolysin [Vibrio sp. 10N.261.45.E1]PMJ36014.1 aerolysin [Vibrio sp. 10N.286.45.B6]PML91574.1 aerolysin [Vibrio sp. 10N.261.49.E11]PMM75582.1 aerolysin [Vibrio sp. 10N.261.46.F12]PMM82052.1 aerolysin [Vibrio sp. 10N.261.46.E8]